MELTRKNVLKIIEENPIVNSNDLWDKFIAPTSFDGNSKLTEQYHLSTILRKLQRDSCVKDVNTDPHSIQKFVITDKGKLELKPTYVDWIKNPDNIWKVITVIIIPVIGWIIVNKLLK